MIISDLHTHTSFSDDCSSPFYDSIATAMDSGIELLAITDHHDPGYPNVEIPFHLNFDEYLPALDRAREIWPGRIAAGIEMGIMEGELSEASHIADAYDYDVVIGSFHCFHKMDISTYKYTDEHLQQDGYAKDRGDFLVKFYEYVYTCLKDYNNYDILGHINFVDRYMGIRKNCGSAASASTVAAGSSFMANGNTLISSPEYSSADCPDGLETLYNRPQCQEAISEILKLIISRGKALEINTSVFRYKLNTWFPRESTLRMYRDLGGEMITFGSDAHSPGYYRDHFDDAIDFARYIGFKHHCTYKNRLPHMDSLF